MTNRCLVKNVSSCNSWHVCPPFFMAVIIDMFPVVRRSFHSTKLYVSEVRSAPLTQVQTLNVCVVSPCQLNASSLNWQTFTTWELWVKIGRKSISVFWVKDYLLKTINKNCVLIFEWTVWFLFARSTYRVSLHHLSLGVSDYHDQLSLEGDNQHWTLFHHLPHGQLEKEIKQQKRWSCNK